MSEPQTVSVFDIQRNSSVDGPGLRTSVFFKGCNLRCAWCHNPESQNAQPECMFFAHCCTGCGRCARICPHQLCRCTACGLCADSCPAGARQLCGKTVTVAQIMAEVEKDRLFYDASGGGVTFTGGECMLQPLALTALLDACRTAGIHTAVDTAGHVPWSSFEQVLPRTDLFLYDVKCMDPELHQRYTGVDNALILSNLRRLLAGSVPVWIRIPVIPGVNDTLEEMERIRKFLDTCARPERVELLPYHGIGEHKYHALGRIPPSFLQPAPDHIAQLNQLFDHESHT